MPGWGGPRGDGLPPRRSAALIGAAACIGLAAAGPQWGTHQVESRSSGRDLVLVLDVSRSMLARDLAPNRLERQRLLARRLVRELSGTRIGLVAFAGRAYILAPLTVDRSALELYLDALEPDIVSEGGSSLAAAIRQGTDLAAQGRDERGGRRAVIVISDGEAHEDESAVIAAAGRAARAGVTVHTITVGTEPGAPVPIQEPGGGVTGYVRYDGELVVSRANRDLMGRIADESGGLALQIEQPGVTERLLGAVRGTAARQGASGYTRLEPRNRFRWFAAAALLLLGGEAVLGRRTGGSGWRVLTAGAAQPPRASSRPARVPEAAAP